MSAKALFIVAFVWFSAVVMWSRFVPSFFLGLGRGRGAKMAAVAIGYLLQVFTFGWIVLLILAAYRLFKKH